MIQIADCLVQTHDPWLVALAIGVCGLSSFATARLLSRTLAPDAYGRLSLWPVLATLSAAAGVWSTHFIAMLAFHPAVATGFDEITTLASFLVAAALTACALTALTWLRGLAARIVAGVLLGLSTGAMHFTGLSGLRVPGVLTWNPLFVVLSMVAAISLSIGALVLGGRFETGRKRAIGATLFALSVASLHFTGMAALEIMPDPRIAMPPDYLAGDALAVAVGAMTLVVIGTALTAWFVDRRARLEAETRFRFLARHDMLTSLPNRVLFEEVVRHEISQRAVSERRAAMLCLDLDGFKEVNDLFGHAAGDQLLVEVAKRLQGLLGQRCVAARLGGDEFAILATGVGPETNPAGAAQRVLDELGRPFDIDGRQIDIGCSIGVALYPGDAEVYTELLARADTALSRAKGDGRGVYRFFEPVMDEVMRERRVLAQDLRCAVKAGQLRLEYQPQLDVASDRVSGFEALVRWDHPTRGTIPPGSFISIAEETGTILAVGEWVLREACREAASWNAPLRVAVNLSPAQFRQTGLVELVAAILNETGLAASRLELEVTESLFLESAQRTLTILQQIKALGVRISIDDFGTGYSSLSTLQSFPFDKIKIDRSFVSQIGETTKGTAIVKAILGLGDSLGMGVVAEGVETGEQLTFLRRQRCTEIQGYFCGRPRPIEAYRDVLAGISTVPAGALRVA
jgi:diguanylate cyclase (GGDEF)-like protein